MTILQSLILGVVQGLTEFLPISSSGHLILVPKIFNWQLQSLAFDVALHLGTLLAVVGYFRSDLLQLTRAAFLYKNSTFEKDRRMIFYILLGIIPAGITGALANEIIETRFRSVTVIAVNLIVWGIFLIAADLFAARTERKAKTHPITAKSVAIVGIAQVFSLIPGTSRSGATITAGIFSGLSRTDAARFSFLMSVPLIAAAGTFKLRDIFAGGAGSIETLPLLIGFASSAIVGWFAIGLLMKTLSRSGLLVYGVYRIILAAAILLFL